MIGYDFFFKYQTQSKFMYETCSIPLEPLFIEGSLPPTVYNVVKDQKYCGEIKVGLTFTPEVLFLIKIHFYWPFNVNNLKLCIIGVMCSMPMFLFAGF